MSAFEKVIGYESIKNELMQICDMVHNKERYESLGARMPSGVLLHGDPGIGKTLIAKCFIEECKINTYTLRSNKGTDKFVDEITEVFEKAKKNSPSIIFLDDMDKFANDDEAHRDAKEYVAVQAGIDSVKECDVFVIATTNDIRKLPQSLIRPGRFDKTIIMKSPTKEDAQKIIKHYLNNKKLSKNVNFDDLCNMISYHSCADLETIINEAAISAGFAGKESINMDDLIAAVLRLQYNSPDDLMQKEKDWNMEIEYWKSDGWWGFEKPYTGRVDEDILSGFLEKENINIEEVLINKRYVVIQDGDEYCYWQEIKDTGLINMDMIDHEYPERK